MDQKKFNKATIGIALFSLAVSSTALFFSWSQYSTDYDTSALIRPGGLPLDDINEGKVDFTLEVLNTSKTNLRYYMHVETNIGGLEGKNGKPKYLPYSYESQVVSLTKVNAGSSTYKHPLTLDAQHILVDTHPLAYMSPAEYYLDVRIIDASNGRLLYRSKCFYNFHMDAKVFALDQPLIDTSGESEVRQRECRA